MRLKVLGNKARVCSYAWLIWPACGLASHVIRCEYFVEKGQFTSVRFGEALFLAELTPSVGSVEGAYDCETL